MNLIPSVQYDYSADARVGIGEVFEISPQAGQSVQQGSIITLKVLTEEPQTDTQSEDTNTETTDTSTETSASSGTWATNANLKIGEPDNYEGQPVRLRLVQGSDEAQGGTTILQDQPLTFDENGEYAVGQITGTERGGLQEPSTLTCRMTAEITPLYGAILWNSASSDLQYRN